MSLVTKSLLGDSYVVTLTTTCVLLGDTIYYCTRELHKSPRQRVSPKVQASC